VPPAINLGRCRRSHSGIALAVPYPTNEEAAMADELDRDRKDEEMGRTNEEDIVSSADEEEEFDDLDEDESEEDEGDEDQEA
jgi:hypothetical protein